MSINLFGNEPVSVDHKIRLIELFAGYESQAMAMRNIGADFEIWKTSEWQINSTRLAKAVFHEDDDTDYCNGMSDEDVVASLISMGISLDDKKPVTEPELKRKGISWCREVYNLFKSCHNLGSITNFHGKDLEINDTDKYDYLMFYSFCCQDLSAAGKQAGMQRGSGTRSGLLWEVERLLTECRDLGVAEGNPNAHLPKILMMENVPQVCSDKFYQDFSSWISFLRSIGYNSQYEILNAKNYGVPQNRERCFMVSMLGDYEYEFPEPIPLQYRIRDILEDKVDEKYFINSEKASNLVQDLEDRGVIPHPEDVAGGDHSK